MAGTIITSQYEGNEALADTDLIEVFQPSSGGIRREKKGLLSALKTFFQGAEVAANTTYKDRVKTKVLWTGPLSVVSTPTNLDGGEKFSDWDEIRLYYSLLSDTAANQQTTETINTSVTSSTRTFSDTGYISFQTLSDTSFQLIVKTVALGNLAFIEGISL